jgi:predicted kinase
MRTIILTKGIPASGKTTWAREQLKLFPCKYKRVNRDLMRLMYDDNPNITFRKKDEDFISNTRVSIIERALTAGYDVIMDDTNFRNENFTQMCEIAKTIGDVQVKEIFFDVDPNIAIKRNKNREAKVPEEIIWKMYNNYIKGKKVEERCEYFPKVTKNFKKDIFKEDAIIVDIDGTLAHAYTRNIFDETKVYEDSVDEDVRDLVNVLSKTYKVFVTSGRKDSCRIETIRWLENNDVNFDTLLMRKSNDNRKDSIIKKEIYREFIEPVFNIKYVIDDRPSVVKMWRSLGLTVLQVNDIPF